MAPSLTCSNWPTSTLASILRTQAVGFLLNIDLTLRNDNFGDNTFDTVEVFSDRDADVYVHYFEDRSKMPEGDDAFGNISDARSLDSWPSFRHASAGGNQRFVHHDG